MAILTNPQIVNLPMPVAMPFTLGNFHLKCSSPYVDSGNVTGISPLDLDCTPIIISNLIDMGTYENTFSNTWLCLTNAWGTDSNWSAEYAPSYCTSVTINSGLAVKFN